MTHRRLLTVTAALAALLSLTVMDLRFASAVSFIEPMQVITSGWEQQPLFDLWRVVHGAQVYTDQTLIPYTIAFYNWLFYQVYGQITGAVMAVLGLSDMWLPTVARLVTVAGLIIGTIGAYTLFNRMAAPRDATDRGIGLAFAVYIFFGPLVGFWAFTVRPDLWALMFEIMAVLTFWHWREARPMRAVIAAAVLLYCAWAFKHVNVVTTVTLGLYLLIGLKWRQVFVYSGLLLAAYAATFALGGELYFRSLFQTADVTWDLDFLLRNLINFAVKSTPSLVTIAALIAAAALHAPLRRALLENPAFRLAVLGAIVSLGLMVPATLKEGSAENYYFVVSFYLALVAVTGLRLTPQSQDRTVVLGGAAGWGLAAVALCLVLTGVRGVTSVGADHDQFMAQKACLRDLPRPILTDNQYLSLPWMNPSRPSFILSYNYHYSNIDRSALEGGGLSGLLKDGYFASLALSSPDADIENVSLTDRYKKAEISCSGLTLWTRKP